MADQRFVLDSVRFPMVWVDAIDANRIIVLVHFPNDRSDVIDIVKGANKKQIHIKSF